MYRKLGSGSLMKASGVLNGQLLYRFERRKKTHNLFTEKENKFHS